MNKKIWFFIDDVIWLFRDLTRQKKKSLFDNDFMATLKRAHDDFGLKVQLNAFYRTSFFYGNDEFSLSDMTDAYKKEWEEASDWIKITFHSKEEFPEYPYVNADYSLVDDNFKLIKKEIVRFAGEKTVAYSIVPHFAPISREGVQALCDNGIRVMYATYGEREEYDSNDDTLFYTTKNRLLHNRKKETGLYNKITRNKWGARALCGYNHISAESYMSCVGKLETIKDKEIGVCYTPAAQLCLNRIPLDILEEEILKYTHQDFLSIGNHEQYFYSDYIYYQPDYAEKILLMAKVLHEQGFEYIFGEDLPC